MKLTKNKLKEIIQEEIQKLNEIETEKELDKEIVTYQELSTQIKKKRDEIQVILDDIGSMEKENKKRFRELQKFMESFKIDERKVDLWIAKISEMLKYKVLRPDYMTLWKNAITKVNPATRNVLENLERTQLELKAVETKKVLSIEASGNAISILKKLWSNIKSLFTSFKAFNKIANKLPKIK